MKILIDADGSPVVNITVSIAKDANLEVVIVKNYAHDIKDDYATVVTVDISQDSADYYIVNNVKENDIVVTQDYGLAAMCLSKKACPINQNGFVYTNHNIDSMLNSRYVHGKLRKQGQYHGKIKKRKEIQNQEFESALTALINKIVKTDATKKLASNA